ncbi:MAG TPA: hypothetical protein VK927_00450, partial [Adhaeribacter sp.]|nr:hypothetical protein [Adhaeribacter sp.]
GPEMAYAGDGLSYRGTISNGNFVQAVEMRSESYEMPTQLNIGVAYDLNLNSENRLTFAGNFVSNTASNDQFLLGAEYAFNEKFMVRAGFDYQNGIFGDSRDFAHTGPTFGATVDLPFAFGKSDASAPIDPTAPMEPEKRQKTFGLDYSYRASNPWGGTHSVGIKLGL